jgi:hypothetical protein
MEVKIAKIESKEEQSYEDFIEYEEFEKLRLKLIE